VYRAREFNDPPADLDWIPARDDFLIADSRRIPETRVYSTRGRHLDFGRGQADGQKRRGFQWRFTSELCGSCWSMAGSMSGMGGDQFDRWQNRVLAEDAA